MVQIDKELSQRSILRGRYYLAGVKCFSPFAPMDQFIEVNKLFLCVYVQLY